MSFATALMLGLGGYARGRQQRAATEYQQQRDKTADAYEQQRASEDATTFQNTQQDRQRAQGIDPATNKPFVLPPDIASAMARTRTFNPGAPQHHLQDLYTIQSYLTQTGQPADAYTEQIKSLETELTREAAQKASFANAVALRQIPSQWDAFQERNWDNPRAQAPVRFSAGQQWNMQDHGTPNPPATAGAGTRALTRHASVAGQLAHQYRSTADDTFKKYTFAPNGVVAGAPYFDPKAKKFVYPAISPTEKTVVSQYLGEMATSKSPQTDANALLAKIPPNRKAIREVITQYARAYQQQLEYEQLLQQENAADSSDGGGGNDGSGGGSDANGDPISRWH